MPQRVVNRAIVREVLDAGVDGLTTDAILECDREPNVVVTRRMVGMALECRGGWPRHRPAGDAKVGLATLTPLQVLTIARLSLGGEQARVNRRGERRIQS